MIQNFKLHRTAVFNKVSHPHGKNGEGERWDNGDVTPTQNVFDISETRTQECVVHTKGFTDDAKTGFPCADEVLQTLIQGTSPGHKCGIVSTNSNGGDVMPTLDDKGQSASGPGAQEDKRGGYVITRIEKDVDIAMSYDGYNQTGKEEFCHTFGTCNSESPNNDKVVKVAILQSYGINPFASGIMIDHTPTVETGLTLRKSPGGENGVVQISQMKYIVRRLTPTECERLMGLPDGWTIPKNLEVTDELIEEFRIVHDNFKQIMWEYSTKENIEGEEDENGELPKASPPKPTTHKQVRKWLENITNPDTCSDAPRYKACGNGWATNQPRWILLRLLVSEGIDPWKEN